MPELLFPLVVIASAEAVLALLLLAPHPVNSPAIGLCRSTQAATGKTVLYTIGIVLGFLVMSPLYDLSRLSTRSLTTEWERTQTQGAISYSWLSAMLILGCLLGLFVLRRFGLILRQQALLKMSEGALLKQVKGLQAAYTKILDEQPGAGKGSSAPSSTNQADSTYLKNELREAQEAQRLAETAKHEAENNVQAIKNQSKGLEKEYDRLLAENDDLKQQLARFQPSFGANAAGGRKDR
ncbi:hypothetical protein WJX74_002761 [Apatococcus lobatus]|uniref:Endoplasmic reticulum transmembrane protein n=2 Tax=Apatococcus TaxID=904362 RepID=A0AAW1SJQ1_9CHLO